MADIQLTVNKKRESLQEAVGDPRRELLNPIPFPNSLLDGRPPVMCISLFGAIMRFYHMPELLTVEIISAESGLSKSTVSRNMPWLIENKWVTKAIDVTESGVLLETRYWANPLQDGPGYVVKNVAKSTRRKKIDGATVLKVYSRDGFKCAECGAISRLSVDHIMPLSRGGTDNMDNLRTLCTPCNSRKGAKWEGNNA